MKKEVKELKQKNIKELRKEIENIRQEIAKLKLEQKINPPKDTNLLKKKRKKLAVLLTVLKEKEDIENLTKNKS
jgi:ribosomal protein L29